MAALEEASADGFRSSLGGRPIATSGGRHLIDIVCER